MKTGDFGQVEDHSGGPADDAHNDVMIHDASASLADGLRKRLLGHFFADLNVHIYVREEANADRQQLCEENVIPLPNLLVARVAAEVLVAVSGVLLDNVQNGAWQSEDQYRAVI